LLNKYEHFKDAPEAVKPGWKMTKTVLN
jgi:hypothetical protein